MSFINSYRFKPSSSCPSYLPGKYTSEQIDDFVFAQGYIPVSSLDECDKINLGTPQIMGANSCWAGTYTTGLEKSYIQVTPIDGTSHGVFDGVGDTTAALFNGIYDGNNKLISNVTIQGISQGGFFNGFGNLKMEVRNCVLDNISLSTTSGGNYAHGLFVWSCGVNSIIEDIHMTNGSLTSTGGGEKLRFAGIVCAADNSTIRRCSFQGVISSTGALSSSQYGGVLAYAANNCTIHDLRTFDSTITGGSEIGGVIGDSANVTAGNTVYNLICENTTVTGNSNSVGGAVGYFRRGTLSKVRVAANVTVNQTAGTFGCGGAVGTAFGASPVLSEIEARSAVNCTAGAAHTGTGGCVGVIRSATLNDSVAYGNVAGQKQVGGLVGQRRTATLNRSFSAGVPSGISAIGGLVGAVISGGTVNAAYWDTTTSGLAVSQGGTGQTTVALQTPVAPTGIYSTWNVLIWNFGTSSQYPSLINVP